MPVQLPPKWAFLSDPKALQELTRDIQKASLNPTDAAIKKINDKIGAATANNINNINNNNNQQSNPNNQFLSKIADILSKRQDQGSQAYRYLVDMASKVMSSVEDDPSPVLSGDMDLNGKTVFDSTGPVILADDVAISEDLAVTGACQITGDLTCLTEKTDYEVFSGIEDVILFSVGTWTTTRSTNFIYYKEKTAAAETSAICIDITPHIRTATSKGFKLTSINPIYQITTQALTSQTLTLAKVNYVNNSAVTTSSVTLASSGALNTTVQANPYVTSVAVSTPAYDNTTHSHYCAEIVVVSQASSVYRYYGLQLIFSKSDL